MRENISRNIVLCILAVGFLLLNAPHAFSSPPACFRHDPGKFQLADSVVEGAVVKSRRWTQGQTVNLVAKYRLESVFKGNLEIGAVLIVDPHLPSQTHPQSCAGVPRNSKLLSQRGELIDWGEREGWFRRHAGRKKSPLDSFS